MFEADTIFYSCEERDNYRIIEQKAEQNSLNELIWVKYFKQVWRMESDI